MCVRGRSCCASWEASAPLPDSAPLGEGQKSVVMSPMGSWANGPWFVNQPFIPLEDLKRVSPQNSFTPAPPPTPFSPKPAPLSQRTCALERALHHLKARVGLAG